LVFGLDILTYPDFYINLRVCKFSRDRKARGLRKRNLTQRRTMRRNMREYSKEFQEQQVGNNSEKYEARKNHHWTYNI